MDIVNQIIAQNQSILITLAEIVVFTIIISLIIYHLLIYIGRRSFPEGRLYLFFSFLFLGLLFYIFLDTNQYRVLLSRFINVSEWTTFFIAGSWMIIFKSIMLILQDSLKPDKFKISLLNKVFIAFMVLSIAWLTPVVFPLLRYHYLIFIALWVSVGVFIVFLSNVYFPILRLKQDLDINHKIIGWTALLYINYIWFYKLTITSSLIHSHLPFWMLNNFLKIVVAFTFAYALARKFNSEFTDLIGLKENLEKKVEENTRELRIAKEKIEEASILKTNYFINVAHETKTPLTLIGNYLDRYIKHHGEHDELTILKENFDLLREAMILFLDLEKFEKGEVIYNNNSVSNLSRALAIKMPLYSEQAKQINRQFSYELIDDIHIKSDPLAIERIINNLFDNALKFTDESDEIRITLTKSNEMVQLMISDTGIGIDPKLAANIFDLYYQASSPNNNRHGFGIGLYIVKRTVESLNGTISIKNNVGKGTIFNVMLPLTTESLPAYIPKTQAQRISLKRNIANTSQDYLPSRQNILVIEDNADMLRYMHDELSELYNVFMANNGEEALNLLNTSPQQDVILSDVMMEIMDGFDFYHLISKNENYSSIPFIFITARSNNTEKISMLTQGVSDYIFKPFIMEELKAKIFSVLKNSGIHRKAGLQDAINAISAIHTNHESHQPSTRNKWETFAIHAREYNLTERQIEVIKLVEKGLEYKQIADILYISPKTVHRHIQILFEKFHVHTKLDLLKVLFE